MLGVSLRTAQLWVEAGVLSAWKTVGGHRRILKSSVEQLLAQRSHTKVVRPAAVSDEDYKILVVEDDVALLRLYELTIGGWVPAVKLTMVKNGWEALIAIGHEKPNLLITDLRLPGMDGFRMVRTLKSDPAFIGNMDVIVVTALDKGEIEAFGGISEGVALLHKPFSFSSLEKIVIEKRLRQSGKLSEELPETAVTVSVPTPIPAPIPPEPAT